MVSELTGCDKVNIWVGSDIVNMVWNDCWACHNVVVDNLSMLWHGHWLLGLFCDMVVDGWVYCDIIIYTLCLESRQRERYKKLFSPSTGILMNLLLVPAIQFTWLFISAVKEEAVMDDNEGWDD